MSFPNEVFEHVFFNVSSPLWVGFDFRHFFVPVFELSITAIGQERHKGFWHHKFVWSVVLCLTDLKLFSKAPLFCCLTHAPSMLKYFYSFSTVKSLLIYESNIVKFFTVLQFHFLLTNTASSIKIVSRSHITCFFFLCHWKTFLSILIPPSLGVFIETAFLIYPIQHTEHNVHCHQLQDISIVLVLH